MQEDKDYYIRMYGDRDLCNPMRNVLRLHPKSRPEEGRRELQAGPYGNFQVV